ncbi:thiol:disulfide interchange protein DsbG precursor [Roseomonas sp. TAS13]|nr:thiol:disulfide interchange protein DsbG precursor [Roseomonas sp. TAS13]
MRSILLASCLALAPGLALAEPHCSLLAPLTAADTPPPVSVSTSSPPPAAAPSGLATPSPAAPTDLRRIAALQRIAASGATLTDLGPYHGMRRVVVRTGDQFMLMSAAPDGQAVVGGLMADLSTADLIRIAGGSLTELGMQHGLRGLLVRSGPQFQVFYATPDGERVIPGVMWDAAGKNLTRDQVVSVAGTMPTVTIGPVDAAMPAAVAAPQPASGLRVVQTTTFGTLGDAAAPRLWMFIDPQCSYSVQAMQRLQPFVASGRVQLAVIPLSVLDYEDRGRSTTSALAMLSQPAEQMVTAWSRGDLNGTPVPEAAARLQANMAAAHAIQLRGTPTFIWRKPDGSEGRADGLPGDLDAVLASIGS